MDSPQSIRLFVYGTLRSPIGGPAEDTGNYERVAPHVFSSSPARLADFKMLNFIHYPGVRPGVGLVIGEVFEISDEGLEICDEIEAHPSFFERQLVTVDLADGERVEAWVYRAPDDIVDAGPIPSGDWFDRDRSLSDGRQTLEQALAEDKSNR